MKKLALPCTLAFATAIFLFAAGCQKSDLAPQSSSVATSPSATLKAKKPTASSNAECDPPSYTNTLSKIDNLDGTWTWTWTVWNPTPGNGNNNTLQNLSHWSFKFPDCGALTNGPSISDVIYAGYSSDGINYTSFTPTLQVDPSMSSYGVTDPVLKFNFGTTGTAPSFYRLIVSRDFAENEYCGAFYKSGSATGVKRGMFTGFDCGSGTLE